MITAIRIRRVTSSGHSWSARWAETIGASLASITAMTAPMSLAASPADPEDRWQLVVGELVGGLRYVLESPPQVFAHLVTIQPQNGAGWPQSDPFRAGYSDLNREACKLDPHQQAAWRNDCPRLFGVRRAPLPGAWSATWVPRVRTGALD